MSEDLLDPAQQPKFVNPLPIPPVIDATGGGLHVLQIRQTNQWLGLVDDDGLPLFTTVWGYGAAGTPVSYPGPTIVASRGVPIEVVWKNRLPLTGHLLPVDTTLHMAMPQDRTLADGYVPIVTHLHGGHSDSGSDGLPDAWYTQGFSETGAAFRSPVDIYRNDQPSATLWYHDHTLGMTRLNVYAGLAGFYLLRDTNESRLVRKGVLPGRDHEVGAAIQDRAFTADGQLYLPAFPDDVLPGQKDTETGRPVTVKDMLGDDYTGPYPSIVPEFFGDFIMVNGMAWPDFAADPGQYRFHLLNGSDSRFYSLLFDNPYVKLTLVGSDGGLLPRAVTIMDGDGVQEAGEKLILAPGDRADVVLDFSAPQLRGAHVTLLNDGPAYEPFQGLKPDGSLAGDGVAATPADAVGQVMRFDVGRSDCQANTATVHDGSVLDRSYHAMTPDEAVHTRKLGLFEQTAADHRIMPMLGVAEDTVNIDGDPVPFGPLMWDAPVTETPTLGTTEIWQIYNFTADAHPIHLHLTEYQVLGRHEISFIDADDNGIPDDLDGNGHVTAGDGPCDDVRVGDALALTPMDLGWQDTSWIAPNQSLTLIAKFDLPGEYVWHCHILSHEDNEMMRPFVVVNPPA